MTETTVPVGRPDTFAGILDIVVGFLDAGDAAYRALERVTGKPLPVAAEAGRGVQEDLERLAAALADRPDLDAAIIALMNEPSEEVR